MPTMETIISFLDEIRSHFRVVDVVDILLMSAIVYWGLIWSKETASRRVLIGVTVVLVIYFLSRAFDMVLVSLVLQAGFAVLVIIIVVIFQEDLRRMFERIAGVRWLGGFRQVSAQLPFDVDALVEATFTLAGSKTGALIVLEGSEPLDRHIDGGVALGGHLSQPLLFSIFDSSSPGHDGAVVIHQGRIEKFATHLPISKNHHVIDGRGTRHSAALGLAECSDALAIVVSEERGTVSVAETEKLLAVDSPSVLKQHIESFLISRFPIEQSGGLKNILLRNGWLKLLAISLTLVAWFVLAYNPDTIRRTYIVPIEYRGLPAHHVMQDQPPTEARVTLSGLDRNFRFLEPGSLKISIDLAETNAGINAIAITDRQIRLPLNLTLERIDPRIVRVDMTNKQAAPPVEKAKPAAVPPIN